MVSVGCECDVIHTFKRFASSDFVSFLAASESGWMSVRV